MIFQLTSELAFPHPSLAEDDGLLAIGGDLSPQRLLLAYENGIFPWYSPGEEILWYAPDPRFVIFPEDVYISKSMKQWLKNKTYQITENKAFTEVIKACKTKKRKDQEGTWIGDDMEIAYTKLNQLGFAKSIEIWINDELVGGLYGLVINNCFFGESMFQHVSNASKAALIHLCQSNKYKLVDCQMHTTHLEKMGGQFILLNDFLSIISEE